MKSTKHHKTAGCIVVDDRNVPAKVLLIKKDWGGHEEWVAPKGHMDKGETAKQTALRETIEETGYSDIEIIKFLKKTKYQWEDNFLNKKEVFWYLARLVSDNQMTKNLSKEEKRIITEQKWLPLEKAKEVMTYPDEQALLDLI